MTRGSDWDPDSRSCAADVEPAEQVVPGHCLDASDFP